MQNLKEFKEIVKEFGLDEKETYIDVNNDAWFTQKFLKELMGVSLDTISRNIKEIFDWEILDEKANTIYRNCSHSDKPIRFYSLDILSQLGMTLRSKPARQFQKQLRELFKRLVKGEIKIISTSKTFLDFVDTEHPTRNHVKKRESLKKQGKTINQINRRSLSIFLTNGRNGYLSDLGVSSRMLCSTISDIFNLYITGYKAKELRKLRNIPPRDDIRDHFNPIESTGTNEAENMFGLLVDKEKGKLTYHRAIELAKLAAENAQFKSLSTAHLLENLEHINSHQLELLEFKKFQ